MVNFQPIQCSERISEYKPDLNQSELKSEQDPKEFLLNQQAVQGKEDEMRQKIVESMMQITLQQVQHVIQHNLQQQKANSRQNR